ncbi:short-chain dehydrogenase [Actinosynnema sp. ALI-1.44]|nr:short-chain dehydrogenase [Actinosynnema sp. ALI-1.44]
MVISGGTNGMGRATALERIARGDRVIVIGSDPAKAVDGARFLRADLSSVAEVVRVAGEITEPVDALALFANRPQTRRVVTPEGLEYTFALYYLSRYLLGELLLPQLEASTRAVVVNVAGVGTKVGRIHWDDMQLARRYSVLRSQLQAGRANDLLGVSFAAQGRRARYVLYHPGFTRSGPRNLPIRLLAKAFAKPVAASVAPIVDWISAPPDEPLTASDRGKAVPLSLPTLSPGDAARLDASTKALPAVAALRRA